MGEGTLEERSRLIREDFETLTKSIVNGTEVTPEKAAKLVELLFQIEPTRMKIPAEFLCPKSKKMMVDPVVTSDGETYDRRSIPKESSVFPNNLVKNMIFEWCQTRKLRRPAYEGEPTPVDINLITVLHSRLRNALMQKEAATSLRTYTNEKVSYKAAYARVVSLYPQLLKSFPSIGDTEDKLLLQEDIIAIILNICSYEENKVLIGRNPDTYSLLLQVLSFGRLEARRLAAKVVGELCYENDENKSYVGTTGAIKCLIDLMTIYDNEGIYRELSEALISICALEINRKIAVSQGCVGMAMTKIIDGIGVIEMFNLLQILFNADDVCEEFKNTEFATALLKILKDNQVGIVGYAVFFLNKGLGYDFVNWKSMIQEFEENNGSILQLCAKAGVDNATINVMKLTLED